MPAPSGSRPGQSTSAGEIVHNLALVGEVLSADIATTRNLPAPNSTIRRAEKTEHEGLLKVAVRLDAQDLGALLFAGVGDERMESVLTAAELGAVVIANIVDDAHDLKRGFDVAPEGEFANLSVRVHHHAFKTEQLERPEFLISAEVRDRMQKSYVEFSWSAHLPPTDRAEHAVPIKLINTLAQVLKDSGYERHWRTAIARFHPEWNSEHDHQFLERTTGISDAIDLSAHTAARPELPDLTDLRSALRRELGIVLTEPRPRLKAYEETDSLIRLRLPLSEGAKANLPFAEYLAEEIDRELAASVLDGVHLTSASDGGERHLVLEYSFDTARGDEYRPMEIAAAHAAIFSVIRSHRAHFAGVQV